MNISMNEKVFDYLTKNNLSFVIKVATMSCN